MQAYQQAEHQSSGLFCAFIGMTEGEGVGQNPDSWVGIWVVVEAFNR